MLLFGNVLFGMFIRSLLSSETLAPIYTKKSGLLCVHSQQDESLSLLIVMNHYNRVFVGVGVPTLIGKPA